MNLRASRPEPWVGFGAVLAAAGAGWASGTRPELVLAGVGVLSLTALCRAVPTLLLAGLVLIAPLQAALAQISGRLKTLDEAVVLLFSATVLLSVVRRRPRAVLQHPLTLAVAAFALSGLLGAVVNREGPAQAALGLLVTLDYALLALALVVRPVRRTAHQAVIAALIGLGVVAALVGVLQHLFETAALPPYADFIWEKTLLRVPSLFPHPNDLAYLMLPVTFVSAAGWWAKRNLAFALSAVVGVVGMLLAVSRSSYLALLVGFASAVLFSGRLSKRVLGFALAGSLAVLPLMAPGIVSRIEKIQREGGDARFEYARRGLQIVRRHPALGVGPGRFGGVVAQRYGSDVHQAFGIEFKQTWTTVDSFWLHLLVESGVLGTLAMLALLGAVVALARRRLVRAEDPPEQQILQFAVVMLVPAHVVINLSSMALEANSAAAILWLLVGLALSPGGGEGPEADREPEA